jgi:hypothetical protein
VCVWVHMVKRRVQEELLLMPQVPLSLSAARLLVRLSTQAQTMNASDTWYMHGQCGAQNHSRRHH